MLSHAPRTLWVPKKTSVRSLRFQQSVDPLATP